MKQTDVVTMNEKMHVFFLIFVISLLQIGFVLQSGICVNMTSAYLVDFSYGTGSRFLIGEIYHRIVQGNITQSNMYLFYIVSIGIVLLLYSLLCELIYQKRRDYACLNWIILLSVSPVSIQYLCGKYNNLGRLDAFMLGIMLIGVMILVIDVHINIKIVALVLLSIFGLWIHNVFISTFFLAFIWPIVILMTERKQSILTWILFILAFIVIGGSYLYFQFCGKMTYPDYETMKAVMDMKSDIPYVDISVDYVFYHSLKDNLFQYGILNWNGTKQLLEHLVIFIVINSPWLILVGYMIYQLIVSLKKVTRILLGVAALLAILPYIVASDWGRWLASTIISLFMLIFVMIATKQEGICHALDILKERYCSHKCLFISLFVYTNSCLYIDGGLGGDQIIAGLKSFQFFIPYMIFIALYSCLLLTVLVTGKWQERSKSGFNYAIFVQAYQRNSKKIWRCVIYSAIFSAFFFASDFEYLLIQEGHAFVDLFAPYMLVVLTFSLYSYAVISFGTPIIASHKLQPKAIARYIVAAIVLVGWNLWRSKLLFASAQVITYRHSMYIIKWCLPFIVSFLCVLNYHTIGEKTALVKQCREFIIQLSLGLVLYGMVLGYAYGVNNIDATWDLLWFTLKMVTGTCAVGIVLVRYFVGSVNEESESNR